VCKPSLGTILKNKRFVDGLVITQSTVIARIYDCTGGVLSNPLPYLTMPDSFVPLILGLASDGQRMGLDRTICRRLEDNTLSKRNVMGTVIMWSKRSH